MFNFFTGKDKGSHPQSSEVTKANPDVSPYTWEQVQAAVSNMNHGVFIPDLKIEVCGRFDQKDGILLLRKDFEHFQNSVCLIDLEHRSFAFLKTLQKRFR